MPARAQSENRVASRRKAARIVALIAHRAGERLSVPRVAAYVGVSNRTLHNWCMAHFGLPPARFLREQRLVRAHHVLLTADPGTITVTTVAVRFGFYHLGRFAVVYREVFGERPSDTLRRPTPRMSGEP